MAEGYTTLFKDGEYELSEKRSRFIGYAKKVETEEEALGFVASVKNMHKTATHNVFAYTLRNNNLQRYSDDGEPQGTAGLPVLDVLSRGGITDAAVVVTRYFGGTLLGTGGLVRAYSEAAAGAVKDAGVAVMETCRVYSLFCDYPDYDRINSFISSVGASIAESDFSDRVRLIVSIMKERSDDFLVGVRELTRGKSEPSLVEEKFVPVIKKDID
jgi:uncharacterized YigZ family protein